MRALLWISWPGNVSPQIALEDRRRMMAETKEFISKGRLDALTDGVFAFAMTLLVVNVDLPISSILPRRWSGGGRSAFEPRSGQAVHRWLEKCCAVSGQIESRIPRSTSRGPMTPDILSHTELTAGRTVSHGNAESGLPLS